jgi:DNA-binding CsgD family transcriptional regulator/tetratricopeptide (TPR) repeat protein
MQATGPIGRDAELAEVDAFLAAAAHGFVALGIGGAPGIGKTTLWRAGLHGAMERGMRVLSSRPDAAEAKLSFAGLADLLGSLDDKELERLPDPQRAALRVALLRVAPSGRPPDPRTIATGVLSLIRALAGSQPILFAIDDAPWLDRSSRSALAFVMRRLDEERVGLLFTSRHDVASAPTLLAVAPERLRRLELGPLSPEAIGRMVMAHSTGRLSRPTLARIADASGGNPFFALEIARVLDGPAGARGDRTLPVPEDVLVLVQQRIAGLPPVTRHALLRSAMLSAPDVRSVDVADLAPAEEAGLVQVDHGGHVLFAHPLFASAVYRSATAASRQALHQTLAVTAPDPEQRARHLALGADAPDERIAIELDRAALLARSRGAIDTAAELAELALRSTPVADAGRLMTRAIAAATYDFDAGDLPRAQLLLEQELGRSPVNPQRGRALQLLARIHSHRSGFATALEVATAALDMAEASDRPSLELDRSFYRFSGGDFAGAESDAMHAVQGARSVGDRGAIADALAVRVMVRFLNGRGVDRRSLARALALEDPGRARSIITHPRFVLGLVQLWTGHLEEARATLGRLHDEMLVQGRETEATPVLLYLVWACLWQGDLPAALVLAQEARTVAELTDDLLESAVALAASALARAYEGGTDLVRTDAGRALALFARLGWRAGSIWALWALGLAALSEGDPAAADATLGPLASMLLAAGLHHAALAPFLPDEIEALVALGRHTEAEPFLGLLDQLAEQPDQGWALTVAARSRAIWAASRGDLAAAEAALGRAFQAHARLGMPFERARTLLIAGQVQRRLRRRRAAREALREALSLFEAMGARIWAKRAGEELERTGTRLLEDDQLTATERRVAELAASGLSNREVAERAFLSVKTVEANLTRTYRKLGLRSRTGLSRAMAGEEAARIRGIPPH